MGWRRDVKECLIRAFGSKCGICGYDRCNEALEFHHLTPEKKDFSLSNFKFENVSSIIRELKKCVCVCGNCHREIHNGIIEIPDDITRYNCKKSKGIIEFCKGIYDKMLKKQKKRKKKVRYRNKNVV